MKNLLYKLSSLHVLAATAILTVFSAGLYLLTPHAAATSTVAEGQHLITLHDGGKDKSFITSDATLGDAFKDAHIAIDSADLVEPSQSTVLRSSNYDVNIYRAQPVTIIDGGVQKRVMSPYRTARQIVEHAGLTLHDEDRTTLSGPTDVMTNGPGLTLTIDRATPFTLVLYGKSVQSFTQAKTVGDMLNEKHITLAKNDTVSMPQAATLSAGMSVAIWRNGSQTVTQQEDVAFDTKQIQDADQPVGYKQIQTPGKNGTKMVTYQIIMQNGVEVSRTIIQSVDVTPAVQQVEVIGTKVSLPPGSHTDWMAAAGIAASDYGYADYIISHESGWRYNAQGYGTTYGLCQAYPGGKMASAGPDWQTNPITQLKWCAGYASKYGGWAGAYNHWIVSHNW